MFYSLKITSLKDAVLGLPDETIPIIFEHFQSDLHLLAQKHHKLRALAEAIDKKEYDEIIDYYYNKARRSAFSDLTSVVIYDKARLLNGDYAKVIFSCLRLSRQSLLYFPVKRQLQVRKAQICAYILMLLDEHDMQNFKYILRSSLLNYIAETIYLEYLFAKKELGSPQELSEKSLNKKALAILNDTSVTSRNLEFYRELFSFR